MACREILPGDPAPRLTLAGLQGKSFTVDSAAGRWLLLVFAGSGSFVAESGLPARLAQARPHFDDERLSLFTILVAGPVDGLADDLPGWRWLLDSGLEGSKAYGAAPEDATPGASLQYRPRAVLLDPQFRVFAVRPLAQIDELLPPRLTLPEPDLHAGGPVHAPILMVPRVFEPDFCRSLIDYWEAGEQTDSGFMREVDGKTVGIVDHGFKRRTDCTIMDPALVNGARARVTRRLLPEVERAFQFRVTRMERYIVACYDGETSGHFRPHRDNTTSGTAHRKFAVTINLNAGAYEGGDLIFPEFGFSRGYCPPSGAALVFSCSLLHMVRPVTRGRRFAFLPFLYDEAAAALRAQNNARLAEGVTRYELDGAGT